VTARPPRRRGRDDRGSSEGRTARDGRRRHGSRRPLRLLSPARAGGLFGLLIAGLLLRLATTSSVFALDRVDAPKLHWTSADAIQAAVGLPLGVNVFEVDTAPIEARLRALPAVASASVRIGLPTSLVVQVAERDPILAWRVGDTTFLVDREGRLFATIAPGDVAALGVPVVADDRVASPLDLTVGGSLDPVDRDVAASLGSLVPGDIGSAASRLTIEVNDDDGYVLRGAGQPWRAVFGIYTSSVRPPSLIPGQVRLLRSLLLTGEGTFARIVLADPTNGTYTPRATPKH